MFLPRIVLLVTIMLTSLVTNAEIYDNPEDVRPLLPGMSVPSFMLKTVSGETETINPSSLEKPVVITFFRGGWCPYCNLHLSELRKAEEQLKNDGFDVWFISADRPELLYESLTAEDIDYQLYSDGSLDAAQAFGVAFKVNQDTLDRFASRGRDLSEISGDDKLALPVPATYIVGTDGRVHFQYTNPDYSIRLSPNVLLAAAEAYKAEADKRFKR